ncbi:hybrid sensor histidine kinase/response regulator [Clostridiaceae bacterium HSG29]|nr:hybrid sensor histidine kinase/response regulator [Clostridiaceae bacterium HSG29]
MENNKIASNYKKITDSFYHSKYPIYIVDKSHTITFVNKYIEEKYPNSVGKKCYKAFYNNERPCDKCLCRVAAIEKDIVVRTSNEKDNILDIEKAYIKKIYMPLKNEFVVLEYDNTVDTLIHEETQNELIAIKKELNNFKINEDEKNDYYINLIHELQSSLINVNEIVLSLKNNYKVLENNELIENIETSLSRGEASIDKLFKFNEISRTINLLNIEKFNLIDLIKNIRIRYNQTSKNRKISFSVNVSNNMKEIYFGDEEKIRQVIENVLDNSFDFTVDGFIKVNIYEIKEEDSVSTIKISVKDSGIGIPKEQIDLIYKRYYKINNVFSRSLGRAGLGLSITKDIIDLMNGKIDIESEIGVGTTIDIIIKLKNAKKKVEEIRNYGFKKKILVVGVEEILKYVIKFKLRDNYEIEKAVDGEEGLMLYYKYKPDIVLIDIMSDKINGFDFYDEIYKNNTHKASIIATSDRVLPTEEEYLVSYGFDDYISKPIDYEILSRKLKKL